MLINNQIKYVLLFSYFTNAAFINGQDNEKNYVVTLTKSSLKPMAQVEDGSGDERKDLFDEFARKMNPLTLELKMYITLGHYWIWCFNRCINN
jgi:hypothetical protein